MFKLLVYGYVCGIYSTRKLEQACRKNIDFIWLLQGEPVPDYSSFARFRSSRAKDAIEDLFYQFVRRLAVLQETEHDEVFIDGTGKTKKYREQIWRVDNMEYLHREDCYRCAAGRKLPLRRSCTQKKNGIFVTYDFYRCESCADCPLRGKCLKSQDPDYNKEIKLCREFDEHRTKAHQTLTTAKGIQLRMNRSIQVEGAFGVLKSNRKFKRFLMRGKTNIATELFLLCMAFDLKKYAAKLQQDRLQTHLFQVKNE